MKKFLSLLFFFNFSISLLFSQYHDFGFEKSFNINVKKQNLDMLPKAWLGGLNSCQFQEIDLNFDGIKDMLVFDRTGNRLLAFVNNGTPNTIDYTYAPEYEKYFPYIHDWLFLVDYNNDGKEDIFTYSIGGMSVFRNDSDPVNGLVFTKMTHVLNSLQYVNYLNLYVSEVEIPAIADVNGDGCPDILVFHILGSYLNLHTNQSFTKYGHCDSLDFARTHHCWGNFFESENSPNLTINISCPFTKDDDGVNEKGILHVGSTLLALDLDSNGRKDLLIGDTDSPILIAAYNGGTLQEAHITQTAMDFPSNTKTVELYSMPMPSLIDLNNDGKKDLLASPFDANPLLTESKNSIWYYMNEGTPNVPIFTFQGTSFLQEEMIDVGTGAYPVLYDIDDDGLTDLFVANYGYRDTSYYQNGFLYSTFVSNISFYKNTGTQQQAEFTLITEDFAGISAMQRKAIYPAFGDIDGDGDIDMIIGEDDGSLHFLENIAGTGNTPVFANPVSNYAGIDVGRFSAPQLVDLNNNNLLDLVIGDRKGQLHFYQNTGSVNNPVFTFITDTLGNVMVKDPLQSNYGYSVPCFFKDSLGNFKLFVGSESGRIHYYDNIDNNLNGSFTLKEEQLLLIYEGARTGVAVGKLNNDNYPDLIVGNFSGGLNLYMGKTPDIMSVNKPKNNEIRFKVFPNPATEILNISTESTINPEDYVIDIYDFTGKMVLKQNFVHQINIRSLSKGLHVIRIMSPSQKDVTLIKFIVL